MDIFELYPHSLYRLYYCFPSYWHKSFRRFVMWRVKLLAIILKVMRRMRRMRRMKRRRISEIRLVTVTIDSYYMARLSQGGLSSASTTQWDSDTVSRRFSPHSSLLTAKCGNVTLRMLHIIGKLLITITVSWVISRVCGELAPSDWKSYLLRKVMWSAINSSDSLCRWKTIYIETTNDKEWGSWWNDDMRHYQSRPDIFINTNLKYIYHEFTLT